MSGILSRSNPFIPFECTYHCTGFHITCLFGSTAHTGTIFQQFFSRFQPHHMHFIQNTMTDRIFITPA